MILFQGKTQSDKVSLGEGSPRAAKLRRTPRRQAAVQALKRSKFDDTGSVRKISVVSFGILVCFGCSVVCLPGVVWRPGSVSDPDSPGSALIRKNCLWDPNLNLDPGGKILQKHKNLLQFFLRFYSNFSYVAKGTLALFYRSWETDRIQVPFRSVTLLLGSLLT